MSEIFDERRKALEEEYFRRKEQEALEKLRAKLRDQAATAQLPPCPKCDGRLIETEFEKIKIDQCSRCGGVWLDPGELQQLMAREEQGWLSCLWHSLAPEKG